MSTDADQRADASVEPLGRGVHLFRWRPGFYTSMFVVTDEGVVAVDPIDETAAAAYRDAVASVTDAPITTVVYSHDHRDHITGAHVLAPEADIVAHVGVPARLALRDDDAIPPPTRTVADHEVLRLGGVELDLRWYGPNHSPTNLAIGVDVDAGRLLALVDVVEPDVAPYRDLPDTDLRGTIATLDALEGAPVDLVLGGHTGPADAAWIGRYRAYFHDLVETTARCWGSRGGQQPLPDEDGVAMTERLRDGVCAEVADALRPAYGSWRGFDVWAPRNADRAISYVITGA